jgi:hypothetical protein
MRTFLLLPIIAIFCMMNLNAGAQDQPPPQGQDQPEQLNLPGDNLNLYAVMKIFQESPTLEEFEKKLNDQSLKINNLDLDGDNQIDYIKVVDNIDGDTHNIALKVDVNKSEDQDVAVFVVKKDRNGQVQIQLIGDEALYGKNYIVEPNSGSSTPTPNPGYTGDQPPPPPPPADGGGDAYYAPSSWPVVQFIYVPTYSPWISPWRWGYYPSYWSPWTPFFWHEYYGYQYHWNYYYRAHYRYTPVYRFPAWRDHYYGGGYRSTSVSVTVRFNRGDYRQTYSRPDYANRGADLFRRDHPNAPHVNRPLPKFDNNNNNRPIITGRDRDFSRPGNGNNNNRPGNGNRNDFNNRPGDGNNANRPVTRPVDGSNNNTPNRPGDGNNTNRPVTRPAFNTKPADANNTPAVNNRPVNRPQFTKPADNNTAPVNNRPARQQFTKPADNNNNNRPPARQFTPPPARQASTPPAPRPQQQPRPSANKPTGDRPRKE